MENLPTIPLFLCHSPKIQVGAPSWWALFHMLVLSLPGGRVESLACLASVVKVWALLPTNTDSIRDSAQIGRVFGCWATIIQRVDAHIQPDVHVAFYWGLVKLGNCVFPVARLFFPETRVCLTESNRTLRHYTKYCVSFHVRTYGCFWFTKTDHHRDKWPADPASLRVTLRREHVEKRFTGKTPPNSWV